MGAVRDGGPAFPFVMNIGEGSTAVNFGMSLRDWFAGQALPAVIAVTSSGQHNPDLKPGENIRSAMARDAYSIADAMLAARKVGGEA